MAAVRTTAARQALRLALRMATSTGALAYHCEVARLLPSCKLDLHHSQESKLFYVPLFATANLTYPRSTLLSHAETPSRACCLQCNLKFQGIRWKCAGCVRNRLSSVFALGLACCRHPHSTTSLIYNWQVSGGAEQQQRGERR